MFEKHAVTSEIEERTLSRSVIFFFYDWAKTDNCDANTSTRNGLCYAQNNDGLQW